MGLGFEIIWPGKPDCEQGAMYEQENLGQFRLTVLAGAIPACSSFELLQHCTSYKCLRICNMWWRPVF